MLTSSTMVPVQWKTQIENSQAAMNTTNLRKALGKLGTQSGSSIARVPSLTKSASSSSKKRKSVIDLTLTDSDSPAKNTRLRQQQREEEEDFGGF